MRETEPEKEKETDRQTEIEKLAKLSTYKRRKRGWNNFLKWSQV
jgi:hypothetical protein